MSRPATPALRPLWVPVVLLTAGSICHVLSQNTRVPTGPVRLWRNGATSLSYTSGRVQISFAFAWGNICDDTDFGLREADVICHQLGYTGASNQSRAEFDSYGTDVLPTLLDNVRCSTNDFLVILQCSYSTQISSSCFDARDISVSCYATRIWSNPYNGQIRLTGGDTVNKGLVEIYCNGQWGTVCDDFFGGDEAATVCRQLGYSSAYRYDHLSLTGNSSQPIWLDDVMCHNTRRPCITNCQNCPSTMKHNCQHSKDVTVECTSGSHYTGTRARTCNSSATGGSRSNTPNGPVSLWRSIGPSYSSGRVHIYVNNTLGNICQFSNFGLTEATVICHQLGFTGASGHSSSGSDSFGIDGLPVVLQNVQCSTRDLLVILQCNYSTQITSSCNSHSSDVSVTCYATRIWSNPYDGQVRLTGGNTVNRGLVEVYCNGQWGTVCDDSFGFNEATTVCRQLGYSAASIYSPRSIRGNSSHPIWLDNLQCNTRQSCLRACQSCPSSENHNCAHSEDVTVECYSSSSFSETATTCLPDVIPSFDVTNGPIRLWRNGVTSPSYTSGRVQIYHRRSWGNICDDSQFGLSEATVICHQLGYTGASSQSRAGLDSFGTDHFSIILANVRCFNSDYLVILQCRYSTVISSRCDRSDDASVTCYTNRIWSNPYSGQIRLTGGDTVNKGLVEIYCNGQWGTVCNNELETADHDTICRQLGYSTSSRFASIANISRGSTSQPIWLDRTFCNTAQPCIASCRSCPSPVDDAVCSHNLDAIVVCYTSQFYNGTNSTCVHANRSTNIGAIVGGVLGGFSLAVIIIVLGALLCLVVTKWKQKKQRSLQPRTHQQPRSWLQMDQRHPLSRLQEQPLPRVHTTPSPVPRSTHTMPSPSAQPPSESSLAEPSAPTITEKAPPPYHLHSNFSTFREGDDEPSKNGMISTEPPPYEPPSDPSCPPALPYPSGPAPPATNPPHTPTLAVGWNASVCTPRM